MPCPYGKRTLHRCYRCLISGTLQQRRNDKMKNGRNILCSYMRERRERKKNALEGAPALQASTRQAKAHTILQPIGKRRSEQLAAQAVAEERKTVPSTPRKP
jgi:hypothetical protein